MVTERTKPCSRPKLLKGPALLAEIMETQSHTDTADADDTYDTCSASGIEALTSALNDLLGRVKSLEKDKSSGNPGLSEVLPQVERARLLTERLDREVQEMKQGLGNLRVQVEALALGVGSGERGRGGGEDGKACANAELVVLDCNQASMKYTGA